MGNSGGDILHVESRNRGLGVGRFLEWGVTCMDDGHLIGFAWGDRWGEGEVGVVMYLARGWGRRRRVDAEDHADGRRDRRSFN